MDTLASQSKAMPEKQPAAIRIEQLNDDNFPKFHQLFNTVFHKKHTLDWLLRKYDTAYLDISGHYLGCIAINEAGEAVSYCGHIPFRFEVEGQQFIGAHSCDHMTLEAYRGRGLFQLMNTKSEELVIAAGIPIIFGFPNQNNHPILVKHAQWKIIDTMQAFVFSVKTLPLAGLLLKHKGLAKGYQRWSRWVSARYPQITANISSVKQAGLLRDEAFYAYKQAFRKSEIREFRNGKVWLHLSGHLAIGDMVLKPNGNLLGLIAELKAFARKLFISRLSFLCSSYHPLATELTRISQPVAGNGVGLKYMNQDEHKKLPPLLFTYGDYDTF